jgi:hypothetical protein
VASVYSSCRWHHPFPGLYFVHPSLFLMLLLMLSGLMCSLSLAQLPVCLFGPFSFADPTTNPLGSTSSFCQLLSTSLFGISQTLRISHSILPPTITGAPSAHSHSVCSTNTANLSLTGGDGPRNCEKFAGSHHHVPKVIARTTKNSFDSCCRCESQGRGKALNQLWY